jgi:hypothetical protein
MKTQTKQRSALWRLGRLERRSPKSPLTMLSKPKDKARHRRLIVTAATEREGHAKAGREEPSNETEGRVGVTVPEQPTISIESQTAKKKIADIGRGTLRKLANTRKKTAARRETVSTNTVDEEMHLCLDVNTTGTTYGVRMAINAPPAKAVGSRNLLVHKLRVLRPVPGRPRRPSTTPCPKSVGAKVPAVLRVSVVVPT